MCGMISNFSHAVGVHVHVFHPLEYTQKKKKEWLYPKLNGPTAKLIAFCGTLASAGSQNPLLAKLHHIHPTHFCIMKVTLLNIQ